MISGVDVDAFKASYIEDMQEEMVRDLLALQAALNYFITASIIAATKFSGHTANMTVIQLEVLLERNMTIAGVPVEIRRNIIGTVNSSHRAMLPEHFFVPHSGASKLALPSQAN